MIGVRWTIVRETETGLLYQNGRFLRTLGPGRHRLRNWPWLREEVAAVDLRRRSLLIAGQEMLTADGLTVKLNLVAEFQVVDAPRAVHGVVDYTAALYAALQLLLREEVQARPLDLLLAERQALGATLLERARPAAEELGLVLVSAGVKDIVLPGDVRRLLAQEAEALRNGRAALVAAREELAATRARANTAKLLDTSAALFRLKEIEALGQIAEGEGNTVVLALPTEALGPTAAAFRRGE